MMTVLISVSTVLFGVLCLLLVIIILLQSDKSAGMGILGGSSQSTFGSSTADIITKITTVFVAIFMLGSLGLAVLQSWKEKSIGRGLVTEEARPDGTIDKSDKSDKKLDKKDYKSKDKVEEPGKKQ